MKKAAPAPAPRQVLKSIRPPGYPNVVPLTYNGARVTTAELQDVLRGLALLPPQDLALLEKYNVPIQLVPTGSLGDSMLGATDIIQRPNGRWEPTRVRVAVRANLQGSESTTEITQHEVGHAIAVLRAQDRSEEAAIAYARRY